MDEYYTMARQLPRTGKDDSIGIEVFFVGIKKTGVYSIDGKEVTNRKGSAIIYTDKGTGEKCDVKVAVKTRTGVINEYPLEFKIE